MGGGGGQQWRWTVERVVLIITCVTSVLGFTFGIGVNYADITHLSAKVEALEAADNNKVSTDVYQINYEYLRETITRLAVVVERLEQSQLRDQRNRQ